MRCAKVRDLFSSYLEGEMDVPTNLQFEQHLSECRKCKADYDRFNAAVVILDEMPEVDPPTSFHASVMARVEQVRRTEPSPVKWWQIDWQHVFTIRVPARAAALAAAAVVLLGVVVQMTPVGTTMMNLLGVQKISKAYTVGEPETGVAPSWSLPASDNAVYDMSGSGLSISVTSQADTSGRTYALRLQSKSAKPLDFTVDTGDGIFQGSVAQNQYSIIRVPVEAARDLAVAEVKWTNKGRSQTQYVFLPQKFNPEAYRQRLSMKFQNITTNAVLRKIATRYGVVILASGNLGTTVGYAEVQKGDPLEALYNGVEEPDQTMKKSYLAPSIYIVEPAK